MNCSDDKQSVGAINSCRGWNVDDRNTVSQCECSGEYVWLQQSNQYQACSRPCHSAECWLWHDNEPPFTQFVIRHLSFDDRPILSLALGDPTQCPPAQAQMIKTTPMVHVYLLMNKLWWLYSETKCWIYYSSYTLFSIHENHHLHFSFSSLKWDFIAV